MARMRVIWYYTGCHRLRDWRPSGLGLEAARGYHPTDRSDWCRMADASRIDGWALCRELICMRRASGPTRSFRREWAAERAGERDRLRELVQDSSSRRRAAHCQVSAVPRQPSSPRTEVCPPVSLPLKEISVQCNWAAPWYPLRTSWPYTNAVL